MRTLSLSPEDILYNTIDLSAECLAKVNQTWGKLADNQVMAVVIKAEDIGNHCECEVSVKTLDWVHRYQSHGGEWRYNFKPAPEFSTEEFLTLFELGVVCHDFYRPGLAA